MLVEDLLRCQIQEWYPAFRRHTIPTVIIPLPVAFLCYLSGQHASDADSDEEPLPFLLPEVVSGRQPFAPVYAHLPDPVSQLDRLNSDFFGSADDDFYDPDAEHPLRPAFPELEAAVDAAIADLGGAALPKLNWSAPKDATFMSADATIRCTCFSEVALLLRSSDCVAHDLVSARPSCEDFVLPGVAPQNARGVRRKVLDQMLKRLLATKASCQTAKEVALAQVTPGRQVRREASELLLMVMWKMLFNKKIFQRLGWMMGSSTILRSANGIQGFVLNQSFDVLFGRRGLSLFPRETHQLTTRHSLGGVLRFNQRLRLSLRK
jgi:hypothetical protein